VFGRGVLLRRRKKMRSVVLLALLIRQSKVSFSYPSRNLVSRKKPGF